MNYYSSELEFTSSYFDKYMKKIMPISMILNSRYGPYLYIKENVHSIIYIPTNSAEVFSLLHILARTYYLLCF